MHIADEIVLDRPRDRVVLVEQIARVAELPARTLHRRAREAQRPRQLVELQLQGELPERPVRAVEQVVP